MFGVYCSDKISYVISEGNAGRTGSSFPKKFTLRVPSQFILDNGVTLISYVESYFSLPDVSTAWSFRFAQNELSPDNKINSKFPSSYFLMDTQKISNLRRSMVHEVMLVWFVHRWDPHSAHKSVPVLGECRMGLISITLVSFLKSSLQSSSRD